MQDEGGTYLQCCDFPPEQQQRADTSSATGTAGTITEDVSAPPSRVVAGVGADAVAEVTQPSASPNIPPPTTPEEVVLRFDGADGTVVSEDMTIDGASLTPSATAGSLKKGGYTLSSVFVWLFLPYCQVCISLLTVPSKTVKTRQKLSDLPKIFLKHVDVRQAQFYFYEHIMGDGYQSPCDALYKK